MTSRWTAGRVYTLTIGAALAALMVGLGIPPLLDDGAPAPPTTIVDGEPQPAGGEPLPPATLAIPRFGDTTTTPP